MNDKTKEIFFQSSAALLFLSGAAKLYSATGTAGILKHTDQLMHVNIRALMIGVALAETGVGLALAWSRRDSFRASLLLWLSVNFLIYRAANNSMGIKDCPCLGTIGQKLPLSQAHLNEALLWLTLYWVSGSGYLLWRVWIARQNTLEAEVVAGRRASI